MTNTRHAVAQIQPTKSCCPHKMLRNDQSKSIISISAGGIGGGGRPGGGRPAAAIPGYGAPGGGGGGGPEGRGGAEEGGAAPSSSSDRSMHSTSSAVKDRVLLLN